MKKIIFLLAATVAIFSACSSPKPDSKSDLSLADQMLDQKLYAEAVGSGNVEKCAKIAAKELKQECAEVVDAGTITNKAVADGDTKACAKIKLDRYRENCEAQIDEAQANVEKQKNLNKEYQQNIQIDDRARSSDDETLCADIGDENQKNSCYYNIFTNRALKEKNISLCEKIPSKDLAAICQDSFNELN